MAVTGCNGCATQIVVNLFISSAYVIQPEQAEAESTEDV